jgi:hypothetical protein
MKQVNRSSKRLPDGVTLQFAGNQGQLSVPCLPVRQVSSALNGGNGSYAGLSRSFLASREKRAPTESDERQEPFQNGPFFDGATLNELEPA